MEKQAFKTKYTQSKLHEVSHSLFLSFFLLLFIYLICDFLQIKKTSEATLTTIQDMVTIEDYDVSECFHHSRSTESVKSTVSETYLSKPSIAKRRANQQETEQFYFMVSAAVNHNVMLRGLQRIKS